MKPSLIAIAFLVSLPAFAGGLNPLVESRYCTVEPVRDKDGRIFRRSDVLTAFKKAHPCPATGLSTGPCKNWYMDHVIPLAVGGCDAVWNLQWLPGPIKTCAGEWCKDRWERTVYLRKPPATVKPKVLVTMVETSQFYELPPVEPTLLSRHLW